MPPTVPSPAAPDEVTTIAEVVAVLRRRIDELGLTRGQLAELSGLNAASLRRLLTSPDANPTLATLLALAEPLELRLTLGPMGEGGIGDGEGGADHGPPPAAP